MKSIIFVTFAFATLTSFGNTKDKPAAGAEMRPTRDRPPLRK